MSVLTLPKYFQMQPTFYCFESYCIHRTLDYNSVLFMLVHISCTKFGEAGKTMPKFLKDFTKLYSHEFLKEYSTSSTGKAEVEMRHHPQVSSDHQAHGHAKLHNPRISFLFGEEPDAHEEAYIQLRTTQCFEIFFPDIFGAGHFEKHG